VARIIVIRTNQSKKDGSIEEIDAAIVVQDDSNEIIVHGEEPVIRNSVEKFISQGHSLDEVLQKFDRPPYVWSVEMEDN